MSAVREAIKAVLAEWVRADALGAETDPLGGDEDLFLDDLVAAVERVPVTVTIRDLSMIENENVVTVVNGMDLAYIRSVVVQAEQEGALHLTVDNGALKIKPGNLSWCAPVRTKGYEG